MTGRPTSLDRRLLDAMRASVHAASIPVLVGGCGIGRTERLRRVQHELGPRASQYIDLEHVSTTPERCCRAMMEASPFVYADQGGTTASGARPAFDAMLLFLMNATHADGGPATFLLDEILELRTFESFPGLRSALPELARALAHSRNHFIVSTRFAARARRWIETAPERFELVPIAPLGHADVRDALGDGYSSTDADETARILHRLADGRPSYIRALVSAMSTLRGQGGADPISALTAALSRGGELDTRCRFSYELRLHRARGYGALKAILQVLSEEEPLTLTQIAQRLDRTAGSTKDYLSWLQDVDMLACQRKRYSFADPMLRLWVRVYSHPEPPDEERLAREVQSYALPRLQSIEIPPAPPAPVPMAAAAAPAANVAAAGASAGAATSSAATSSAGATHGGRATQPVATTASSTSGIIEID
jgi:hypothetical protein